MLRGMRYGLERRVRHGKEGRLTLPRGERRRPRWQLQLWICEMDSSLEKRENSKSG